MDYVVKNVSGDYKVMLLWLGLSLYNLGMLSEEFLDTYNSMVLKMFIMVGIIMVAFSLFSSLTFSFRNRNSVFKIIVALMFVWYLFMLANSDRSYIFTTQSYMQPYSMLSYSMFFILFFPTLSLIRSLFSFSYIANVIFIFLFLIPLFSYVNNTFVQLFLESVGVGAAFVFITNKYHSNKAIFISLIVLCLSFLVATFEARRNLMLTYGLYIMIGGLLSLVNGKLKSLEAKIITFVTGLLILVGAITLYLSESTGAFSAITGRASENTREEVFLAFAVDMANLHDLAVGRGFSGEYYCPGVDKDAAEEYNDYRQVIECGYLQLILKGGMVYAVLYILLISLAIYRGFKSKNQLVKGCAFILVVQIIDMVPFGIHAFNMKSFIIWMAMAICYDVVVCNMSEDEVNESIFAKQRKILPWEKK